MSSATMEKKETPNRKNGAEASKEIVDVSSTPQEQRTPVRVGKSAKRKIHDQSPSTPTGISLEEFEKSNSGKKQQRRGTPGRLKRLCSPTSLFKPPLTERQQLALLMQMTDVNRHAGSGEESSPRSEVSRSRVQRRNERGETALHVACIKGDLKHVTALVGQGAEINATDNACWTPLHEACNHGHVHVVTYLLEKGANVNAEGMGGDTPLHDAVLNQHKEVIQTLLNHGADPSKRNDSGKRAIDVCKDPGIAVLLEAVVLNEALCTKSETNKGERVVAGEGSPAISSVILDGEEELFTTSSRIVEGEEVLSGVKEGEEEKVVLPASSRDQEKEISVLPVISMKEEEEDGVTVLPISSESKKVEEEEDKEEVIPTSSSGKDEEEEEMVVCLQPSNSRGEEEEEEVSVAPSSSVEEEGEVTVLPSSRNKEEVEEEFVSVLPNSSSDKKEEMYVWPSSSSKEKGEEEEVSVLPSSPGVSAEEGAVSHASIAHTQTPPLEDRVVAALSESFIQVKEEPSSTMCEHDSLSVNKGIKSVEQGEEPSSTVDGAKQTVILHTTCKVFEAESPASVKKEVKSEKEEFYSDISSTDDDLDYFEHTPAVGGRKRMRLRSRGSRISPERPGASGTELSKRAAKAEPTRTVVRKQSKTVVECAKPVAHGDHVASVVSGPVVVGKPPEPSVPIRHIKRITSDEFYSGGVDLRDGDSCTGTVGTSTDGVFDQQEKQSLPDESVLTDQLVLPARQVAPARYEVPDTTSQEVPTATRTESLLMDGTTNVPAGWLGGETAPEGMDISGPETLTQSSLPEPETLPQSSLPGSETLPQSSLPGSETLPQSSLPGSETLPQSSLPGPETLPQSSLPGPETLPQSSLPGPETLPQSSLPGPETLPQSSLPSFPPHARMAVCAAPPTSSPPGMQLELCVSYPLSLVNVCSETLVRLHHQGGHRRTSAEPESFGDHPHLLPIPHLEQQQQEYVAMESTVAVGQDSQDLRLSGDKEPRSHHDRITRHSRKPQQVFSSKRLFKESQADVSSLECTEVMGVVETSDGRGEDSTTISVRAGWGLLPTSSKKGKGQRDSPTPANQPQGKRRKVGDGRGRCDEEEEESTVVSLVASLPLSIMSRPGSGSPSGHSGGNVAGSRSPLVYAETPKPSSGHRRSGSGTQSLSMGSGSGQQGLVVGNGSGQQSLLVCTKEPLKEHEPEDLVLPPKRRYCGRLVQRSMVVQRRRENREPAPVVPANFKSFLLTSRQYRSKQIPQPINPKTVYPPVHTSMYKLFNEHETERIRLLSAHATELDHVVISFEEELVRAHQKAARKNQPPLSVCAFLLERMLPHTDMDDSRLGTREEGMMKDGEYGQESVSRCPPSKEDSGLDSRLLASFVQDVWDKYLDLRTCVLIRQGHESEALWLLQLEQWKDRLQELGFSSAVSREVLLAHVPMVTSIKMSAEED